jgi:hypothetical protein
VSLLLAAALLVPVEAGEPTHARRDRELSARITEEHVLEGVRSASALVRVGGRLLVAQDDSEGFVIVDPKTGEVVPHGPNEALSKAEKPDFEAAFALPDGRILVLGSGAKDRRQIVVSRAPDGETQGRQAPELYGVIQEGLGAQLNLEGAVLLGDVVRVFHRGVGVAGSSATLDVPLDAVTGGEARCSAPSFYDLGQLGGATLGFTDAAPLDDGRILYVAAAEDTPDPVSDGPVVGAAIGVIDPEAGVRWTPLLEADGTRSVRKPEGLLLDESGQSGWLVTDPDSTEIPSMLLRFELDGPW